MTRSFITKAAIVATVALVAPSAASAQNTIVNFTGSARVQDPNGATNPLTGALNIDFLTASNVPGGTTGDVTVFGEEDLIGVAPGSQGTIADLTVNASNAVTQANGGGSFLVLGGYTFNLAGADAATDGDFNFGPIAISQNGRNVDAGFSLFGTVTGPGIVGSRNFFGTFTTQFTARSIGNAAGSTLTVAQLVAAVDAGTLLSTSFSATFDIAPASVVPEPSTYALMASGVAMLGIFARRRRQA